MKITIPASVLVDVLAGRAQLLDHYGGPQGQIGKGVMKPLIEEWSIIACSYQKGDVQQAKDASVAFELAPPHEPVFWPRR